MVLVEVEGYKDFRQILSDWTEYSVQTGFITF